MHNKFISIDFETANYKRNSACALAIVVVEDHEITEQFYTLIKPPENYFQYTCVHGITWEDVKDQPVFEEIWPHMEIYFYNIDFVAAYNAPFDRGVLESCCNYFGINKPAIEYRCAMQMSRKNLKLNRYTLDRVCAHCGIDLEHHNALSDALACARLMVRFSA